MSAEARRGQEALRRSSYARREVSAVDGLREEALAERMASMVTKMKQEALRHIMALTQADSCP